MGLKAGQYPGQVTKSLQSRTERQATIRTHTHLHLAILKGSFCDMTVGLRQEHCGITSMLGIEYSIENVNATK